MGIHTTHKQLFLQLHILICLCRCHGYTYNTQAALPEYWCYQCCWYGDKTFFFNNNDWSVELCSLYLFTYWFLYVDRIFGTKGWLPMHCVAGAGFEVLISLLPSPKFGNYQPLPPSPESFVILPGSLSRITCLNCDHFYHRQKPTCIL